MTQKGIVLGCCHDDGCAGKDGVRSIQGTAGSLLLPTWSWGKFIALPLLGNSSSTSVPGRYLEEGF